MDRFGLCGMLVVCCMGMCYAEVPQYSPVMIDYDFGNDGCWLYNGQQQFLKPETDDKFIQELDNEGRTLYCCRCSNTGQQYNIPCYLFLTSSANKFYPTDCPDYTAVAIPPMPAGKK